MPFACCGRCLSQSRRRTACASMRAVDRCGRRSTGHRATVAIWRTLAAMRQRSRSGGRSTGGGRRALPGVRWIDAADVRPATAQRSRSLGTVAATAQRLRSGRRSTGHRATVAIWGTLAATGQRSRSGERSTGHRATVAIFRTFDRRRTACASRRCGGSMRQTFDRQRGNGCDLANVRPAADGVRFQACGGSMRRTFPQRLRSWAR